MIAAQNQLEGPSLKEPAGGGAGVRLNLLEQAATILLASLPMIFLHWRARRGLIPEQLGDGEIRVLFAVYTAALIATALVRGLAAVRHWAGLAVGVSIGWLLAFQYLFFDVAYADEAVWDYAVLIVFAMVLKWHLLPMVFLARLDWIEERLDSGAPAPDTHPIRPALGRVRWQSWALSGMITLADIWLLAVMVHAGAAGLRSRSVQLTLALPILAGISLAAFILARLSGLRRESVTLQGESVTG